MDAGLGAVELELELHPEAVVRYTCGITRGASTQGARLPFTGGAADLKARLPEDDDEEGEEGLPKAGLGGRVPVGLAWGETCRVVLGLLLGVVAGVEMGEGPSVLDGASGLTVWT